jgi:hypothetical protein
MAAINRSEQYLTIHSQLGVPHVAENVTCVHIRFNHDQWRTQEFCSGGGGCSTNSVEDRGQREWGSGGGSPIVRGPGGSCNLVQEISFHIVNFS